MMQNTLSGLSRGRATVTTLVACLALAACNPDGGTGPGPNPATSTDVSLSVYGVQTVKGEGGVKFVNAGHYAVIPSFAASTDFATGTNRATVPDFPYTIGGLASVSARVASTPRTTPSLSVADQFHSRMRAIERAEAPNAIAYMREVKARAPQVNAQVLAAQAAVTKDFKVLSGLTTNTYTTVTARLVYTGNNILLYVDQQSPTTGGFSDTEYSAFGAQFDGDLYPIDVSAFGSVSDIDTNGKTYVLFTPIVNRLTLNSGQCGSYVAGFFNGADLSGNANGNRAEIFYASVPGEPAGGATCATLSQAVVRNSAPATFIHELQHMISYNQHVLRRSGSVEDVWLNEGLSHMAEELGGKLYETRYPCPNLPPCPPQGRASTAQIFPDSAQGFLPPNFGNAYDFFSSRQDFSLTSPTGFGTTEERGVAWLFLRYLADQKGDAAMGSLVQTTRVGTANIEAVAGAAFRDLFADFLAATLLDDYPGAAAGEIPAKYQYSSRNLRAIYARLNSIASASYPTAYPLDVAYLSSTEKLTPSSVALSRVMKPGSLDLFDFRATAGSGLAFKPSSGTFQANLNAQVTIVRLPN